MNQVLPIVLGSAAIGALMSSVITLVGQKFERESRREELLLSEATKLAEHQMETLLKVAAATRGTGSTRIVPLIEMVHDYHRLLTALFKTGKPDPTYRREE